MWGWLWGCFMHERFCVCYVIFFPIHKSKWWIPPRGISKPYLPTSLTFPTRPLAFWKGLALITIHAQPPLFVPSLSVEVRASRLCGVLGWKPHPLCPWTCVFWCQCFLTFKESPGNIPRTCNIWREDAVKAPRLLRLKRENFSEPSKPEAFHFS